MSFAQPSASVAVAIRSGSEAPSPVFVAARATDFDLRDAPIEPSWILAGTPVARSARHSASRDGFSSTHIWDCTAGTFRWHFGYEETVHILAGEVRITTETGETRYLRAGDIAYFATGSSAVWEIPVYLKKLAYCRRAIPRPVGVAIDTLSRTVRLLRRIGAIVSGRRRTMVPRPIPGSLGASKAVALLLRVASVSPIM